MANLSKTELIILANAAQREDGGAAPDKLRTSAIRAVSEKLISRKLVREVRTKPGMPVWRTAESGRSISLVILRAGRLAIEDAHSGSNDKKPIRERSGSYEQDYDHSKPNAVPDEPRAGSKLSVVIDMLSNGAGTSLKMLEQSTGWLPHTTRAALTRLRKRGFTIERIQDPELGAVYRLTRRQQHSAAA